MAERKDKASNPLRPPGRLERKRDARWPLPTPYPSLLKEDIVRLLKQILYRLDAIEKRLENLEKKLVPQAP